MDKELMFLKQDLFVYTQTIPSIFLGLALGFSITIIYLLITILINFSKYSQLRANALLSFPKNKIVTDSMIESEIIRLNPNQPNVIKNILLKSLFLFIVTTSISIIVTYIVISNIFSTF